MAISPISNNGQSAIVISTQDTVAVDALSPSQNKSATKPQTQMAVPSVEEVRKAAETLNRMAQLTNTSVNFSVDESTGKTVVKVMDTENGQLIRQFPTEEALDLTRAIDLQQGLLLKTKS